jgi:hypothetical protein
MKGILGVIMLANAALFFFGAVQHVGITIGPFREPRIVPAAIVEIICGISLTTAAVITFTRTWLTFWSAPLFGNLIALAGVLLGIVALAAGRGPRTASNDLYHRIMLVVIAVSIAVLALYRLKRPTG